MFGTFIVQDFHRCDGDVILALGVNRNALMRVEKIAFFNGKVGSKVKGRDHIVLSFKDILAVTEIVSAAMVIYSFSEWL